MLLKAILSIIFAPIILIVDLINVGQPEVYFKPSTPAQIVRNQTPVASTTVAKTETSKEKSTSTAKVIVKQKEVIKVETPTASTPKIELPPADFEKINTDSRKTIINIFCTTKYNDLSPISGTGVVITGDGLILTNAHIAQYLLLKDFREKDYLKCIGRTGSPAYPRYNLELVYISPSWVKENKSILKEQTPTGTGEHDFAFLRITGNIDGSQTGSFTYIEPNSRGFINKGEPVLLASYPAGFLGGISIVQDLNVTSAVTNIQDVFTFKDGSIDVISVGGTIISQKGSSGGLVVDRDTSLIGIITTSSNGETTSSRGLNAITIGYIAIDFQTESGMTFRNFLDSNHSEFAKNFNTTQAPELFKLISDELIKQ